LDVAECRVHANGLDDDRSAAGASSGCLDRPPGFGALDTPAGPDGFFFTDDDPWLVEGALSSPAPGAASRQVAGPTPTAGRAWVSFRAWLTSGTLGPL
jgi:hypothetical protein